MTFEKKYWSNNEYTTDPEGKNPFTGFVGIYEGEAYDFKTNNLLYGKNKYLSRINCSSKHFDRVLAQELKLPYSKKDIGFAANDFLYGNIIKTVIERLQENNDYIFRNSIISNSILPATNECVLLASPTITEGTSSDGSTNTNSQQITLAAPGTLKKYNFADYALSSYTHTDPKFYPTTKNENIYFAPNLFDEKLAYIDERSKFIKRTKRIKNI